MNQSSFVVDIYLHQTASFVDLSEQEEYTW